MRVACREDDVDGDRGPQQRQGDDHRGPSELVGDERHARVPPQSVKPARSSRLKRRTVLAAAALLALAILMSWVARNGTKETIFIEEATIAEMGVETAGPPPPVGPLHVESTPAARVFVNDEERGQTPLRLDDIPPGRVRIEGPFGAEVFVAGELVGLLPLEPAEVPVGIQEIVVRHDGREWQETVDVTLREPEVVTIDTSIGGRARR